MLTVFLLLDICMHVHSHQQVQNFAQFTEKRSQLTILCWLFLSYVTLSYGLQ